MKKINLLAGVIVLSIVLFACNQTPKETAETAPVAEQTIENLKSAITGESNASAKYAAFSKYAEMVGMSNIAKIFAAASEAEMIHVNNHQAVLKSLGVDEFEPIIEEYIPKEEGATIVVSDEDISKNLEAAIEGETYEFTKMYPDFIEAAKAENVPDAVKSFEYAMKAEKRHAEHYQAVLALLKAENNDKNVSQEWYICPVCGELTPTIEAMSNCSICGEKVEKFKKF